MTTKNIVNIQNNKLDFYINGTNRFDVTLRGTNFLRVEETGYIIAQQSVGVTTNPKAAALGSYDFIGHISNIDNHDLKNLGDVVVSSLAADELLQYDGTSWKNVSVTSVGATELRYTDGNITGTLDLNGGTIKFAGTANQIVTLVTDSVDDEKVQFSLADDVVVPNTLTVGGANPVFIVDSTDTTVKNNLIVEGYLQVKGTSTILNTEVKLIEDPLIELNYLQGPHVGNSDIGFFGRYATDNYTGFFYDTSGSNFKVFDSMSSNAYDTEMKIIEPTNIAYVPILAKTFEVEGGSVGEDVYELSDTTSGAATINVSTELIRNYLGLTGGIFCGRLIAYSHGNQYLDCAVTTINYTAAGPFDVFDFVATVDLEKKRGAHNYLSYDETAKTIIYTPPTNAATHTPVVKFRILPIVTLN